MAVVLLVSVRAGAYELPESSGTPEISSSKPVKIDSRQMTYDRLKSLILYKGKVVARHGQMSLAADEVQAIADNREASANGRVKVVDASSQMVMTCGNLEYRDRMNTMTAHDHPQVTFPSENGRPSTILSRQMEYYADKKEVVARQNVQILDENGRARAEKATLISAEDKMVLEEDPEVFTPNGELRGRRIETYTGEERRIVVQGMAEATFYPLGSGPVTGTSGASQAKTSSPAPDKGPTAPTNPVPPGNR